MTIWSLMDGGPQGGVLPDRPGVGSSGTQPPATAVSYSGNYIAGLVFQVTQGGMWFQGYRWWVANSNQDTAAQKFALWNLAAANGSGAASNIPTGTITSGALTAGQFNTVMLSSPIALTPNTPYLATTGGALTHGFPDTTNQFGSGNLYTSGITNGPLVAYSSSGGSSPISPGSFPQQPFTTAGSDPSVTFPNFNNANDLLWIDVIVSDQPPGGVLSYRAWPNLVTPFPSNLTSPTDTTGYTLAFEFSLTQACTLDRIWHYSPPTVTGLPSRCLIWDVATQLAVSGTDNSSPSWSGAAGSGWVSCDYTSSGVTLNALHAYKVSTFSGPGVTWFGANADIFGNGGPDSAGFTNGPLVIPNNASASIGQQSWRQVSFGYPNASSDPEADWIDVEVTPAATPPVTQIAYSMRMMP